MRCPSCWSDRAFRRKRKSSVHRVAELLGVIPMRCRHCFHAFFVFRPCVSGETLDQPARDSRRRREPRPVDVTRKAA